MPVFVILADQPQSEIMERVKADAAPRRQSAQRRVQMAAQQFLPSVEEMKQAQVELDAIVMETRQQAVAEIKAAIGPGQAAAAARLMGLGATNIQRYVGINMLAANIPASALDALEADAEVISVLPVRTGSAQLDISAPALGTSAFWNINLFGQGQKVAIIDTGVKGDHPAFSGKTITSRVFLNSGMFDFSCFSDNYLSTDDLDGHGTHMAGIIASTGQGDVFTGATAYQGMAKGIDVLFNLKAMYKSSCGPPLFQENDVIAALDWLFQYNDVNRQNPVTLVVFGGGQTLLPDDNHLAQLFDQYANLGLTIVVPAGNTGPNGYTVQSPGIAYNVITVGNWDDHNTAGRTDDTIYSTSSRGPTWNGRTKPDLVAPGTNIMSTAFNWAGGFIGLNPDFVELTGTSLAAAHIAGGIALLKQYGVYDNPYEIKAVLINSTDNPGWQADHGYGYANLATAKAQADWVFASDSVSGSPDPGHYHFYKGHSSSALRATLAWHRHWFYPTDSYYLNDLDLYLFDRANNQLKSSISTINNVEELYSTYAGDVVLKVQAAGAVAHLTSEGYALAVSNNSFTKATGPSLSVTCSYPTAVLSNASFNVSCTAKNNGDLEAFAVSGTLSVGGLSGIPQQTFGTLAPSGSVTKSWSLTATQPVGTYALTASLASTSFYEPFSANTTSNISVVANETTVATSPAGLSITVDGSSYTAPHTFLWTQGSTHSIGVTSPQSPATGTRYAFGSWSDSGAQTHTITVPASAVTYTATFTTQYLLTTVANPAAMGSVSPATGFYNAGTVVSVSATANPGYLFQNWSGDITGYAYSSPISLTMSIPRTVTANFVVQPLPSPTTLAVTNISTTGATLNAEVVANGSATTWFEWSTDSSLASPNVTRQVPISGSSYMHYIMSERLTGLVAYNTYYYRSVASNAAGTTKGAILSFRTQEQVQSGALQFNPVPPCRAADTRDQSGGSTPLAAGEVREFTLTTKCSSVWSAAAYSLNVTVVPRGPLRYLTVWPSGQVQPPVSLLNSPDGRIKANAAIIPAGSNGKISVFATDTTDVVIDLNGFFSPWEYGYSFFPLSPCRVADTRNANAPLGGPYLGGLQDRVLPIQSSACNIPSTARAYSLNFTAIPRGSLGYLSAWPAGQTWPGVSTLNSPTGTVVANAAIVQAGAGGGISVRASEDADLVIDITGFFVMPGSAASGGLSLYAVTPCRALDTRNTPNSGFSGKLAVDVGHGSCGLHSKQVVLNATVLPRGPLSYLTLWPNGIEQPLVSTLNAGDGQITSNMALVAADDFFLINAFATNPTDLLVDINAIFAPTNNTLTVARYGAGSGTVTSSPAGIECGSTCAFNFNSSAVVRLKAYVDPGSTFSGWTGCDSASDIYCTVIMDRSRTVTATFTANSAIALRFIPATPCRVADTRNAAGPFGGPSIAGQGARDFAIPDSACGIPRTAAAYSVNVTAVPQGTLNYVTVWPTGKAQPATSLLNSTDGRIKANAAIVAAGLAGGISVYASNTTDVLLDINGYFEPATNPSGLSFYRLTPCRVADTRQANGLLGAPLLAGQQERAFPIRASSCNIPPEALAYALNFTVVPRSTPLGYLSAWPTGQAWPGVSLLNAPTGVVTANAAIVPAGNNGAISLLSSNDTDVVIDINGYFAPSAPAPGGMSLYMLTSCRVLDTRSTPNGFNGQIGVDLVNTSCGVPASAKGFVLNATVVPLGPLGYLTLWQHGAAMPLVSTLNAFDGQIASNMAIVPADDFGWISAYATNPTNLILDINGFFAP